MKKIIALVLFFNLQSAICSLQSFAQSIDSVEYFYDADPGAGNGNMYGITPSDSLTDSISFNFPGLSTGFHTLNFRVRDTNGTWSLYETRSFFLNDTIFSSPASFDSSSAEYFFDADPGVGNGNAMKLAPGDSIQDTSLAVTTGLTPGFHNLYVRVKDSNNVWSLYEGGKIFLYDTVSASALPTSFPLEKAEYFYDTDPGVGNAFAMNAFAPADSIQLTDSLPIAPLTAGNHYLYVRVRDTMNTWSLCERKSFIVCNLIPVPDFSADTVCLNKPTAFTDLSSNLDTNFNYTYGWDFNNDSTIDDTTKGNTTHTFYTSGTHTVTLIVNNTNGCVDTITKTVYVDSLPMVTFTLPVDTVCKDDTLSLSGGNPAGGFYSGNGVYGGSLYCDSIGSGMQAIYYTYYNSDSCSATAIDKIYVSPCTGIDELIANDISVTLSPNPFISSTLIKVESQRSNLVRMEFTLFDVFGKELHRIPMNTGTLKLERGDLASGIYFYKISAGNGVSAAGILIAAE